MNLKTVWPDAAALRRLAPGLLLMAALLLLFRDTAAAMVAIWIRSETFAHAFLVPPIVVWLVWRQRAQLATLTPRPAPWVLLPMAAVCLLWLLGELAGVNAATQFALVALLVLSVPAVFGLQVTKALLFPLIFLFFAVPFGEFMVPMLMEHTADFTVAALRLTGVPVYREGLQFIIPTGHWSVVEACSGVRYLIASFMVGTLFAYLNFRSYKRRAVFIAVSLVVPVLANWMRAYLIVMIGHLSGNKLAAGVDHILYGWVFFGIVIGAMFMVGARWAQPDAADPVPPTRAALAAAAAGPRTAGWGVALGVAALLLLTQAALAHVLRDKAADPTLALPAQWPGGWAADAEPVTTWVPFFSNPSAVAQRTYRDGDQRVAVWVGYYRNLDYDRKLVSSTNTLTEQSEKAAWAQVSSGTQRVGDGPVVRTGHVRQAGDLVAVDGQRLRVWQVYWVGGRFMISDARARLELAVNRLLGRGDDGAAIFFYTPLAAEGSAAAIEKADALLGRFVEPQLPGVAALLEATRQAR